MPGICGWGGEEVRDACTLQETVLRDSEMEEGQTHAWATGWPAGIWHTKQGLEARGAVLPAAWKLVQLAAAWGGRPEMPAAWAPRTKEDSPLRERPLLFYNQPVAKARMC